MKTPQEIGRFRILGQLGQGAMGVVYRGRDSSLERDVAIKVMSGAVLHDEESRKRFLREARASARLQHPNIVTIFELGEHEGLPYMALELLEGMDLQRAIDAGIRPDPKLTLPIVMQVLAGLGHAHENGIIHRDVKPSNVFLPQGRAVKIMDFGVARIGGAGLATQGMVVGTPTYMSPEQVKGGHLDGRSDLFSVGLILFELVTGEKCLRGTTVVELLYKIVHEERDLSALPHGSGWDELQQVLKRSLERDPDRRYPDAEAMLRELGEALRAFGGSGDWTSASEVELLLRTPRTRPVPTFVSPPTIDEPTVLGTPSPLGVAPAPQPQKRPPTPDWADAPTQRHPTGAQRPGIPVVGLAVGGAGLTLVLVLLVWWLKPTPVVVPSPTPSASATASTAPSGDVRPSSPGPKASPPPTNRPSPSPSPTLEPVASPSPVPSPIPSPVPSPTTVATTGPVFVPTPTPVASGPTPEPTLEPTLPTSAAAERAEKLLEDGRFAAALAEARSILQRDPRNATAREVAQEAEASLAVEQVLRRARELLAKGDKDDAADEIRKGLAVRPNDARLIELWRQATQ